MGHWSYLQISQMDKGLIRKSDLNFALHFPFHLLRRICSEGQTDSLRGMLWRAAEPCTDGRNSQNLGPCCQGRHPGREKPEEGGRSLPEVGGLQRTPSMPLHAAGTPRAQRGEHQEGIRRELGGGHGRAPIPQGDPLGAAPQPESAISVIMMNL